MKWLTNAGRHIPACRKSLFLKLTSDLLSLSPCPLSPGKGVNTGTGVPATRLGATPKARTLWLLAKSFARCKTNIASNAKPPFLITIEVFLQPAAYSSVFDIYLIQRPCLFSVSAAFTQDIRKKHSCSEWKNRQDYRHQQFIYRSVVAVEHKQYFYADAAQTFTERQTYNHGCKEGYERIRWADG